jgi:hypothetical protein
MTSPPLRSLALTHFSALLVVATADASDRHTRVPELSLRALPSSLPAWTSSPSDAMPNRGRSATPSHRRAARAVFFTATAPPRRRPAFGRLRPCFNLLELHVSPAHLFDHFGDPSTTGSCGRHRFPSARAPPSWVTSFGKPPPWPTPQSSPPRHARAPSRLPVAPHRQQAGAGQATAGSVPWAPSPAQDGPRG